MAEYLEIYAGSRLVRRIGGGPVAFAGVVLEAQQKHSFGSAVSVFDAEIFYTDNGPEDPDFGAKFKTELAKLPKRRFERSRNRLMVQYRSYRMDDSAISGGL